MTNNEGEIGIKKKRMHYSAHPHFIILGLATQFTIAHVETRSATHITSIQTFLQPAHTLC